MDDLIAFPVFTYAIFNSIVHTRTPASMFFSSLLKNKVDFFVVVLAMDIGFYFSHELLQAGRSNSKISEGFIAVSYTHLRAHETVV